MSKNTSVTLGDHFETFVGDLLQSGRFASTSEVIRAALRLLEERETRLAHLRRLLQEGEESGIAEYALEDLVRELDEDGAAQDWLPSS